MTGAERKCRNRQILSEYAYGNIRHEAITFVVRHLYISRNIYTYERDINTFIWRGHSYIWEGIHAYRVDQCIQQRVQPQKDVDYPTERVIHTHKHQRVIHTFIRVSTHMDAYLHICQDIDTYRLTLTLMEGNQHIWRAHTFIMILIHSRNIHTYRKTLTYVVRNKTNKEGIQTFRIQTASSPMGVHTYNGTSTHTLVQGMCGRHLHK